jgi:hypothetical protein
MGIRFRCHHCQSELHVKDFQGGKRGRCPECQGSFRVPTSDAEHSLPLEIADAEHAASPTGSNRTTQSVTHPGQHANQLAVGVAPSKQNKKPAPNHSQPASSQPASSQPASSQPTSSQPTSSQPASSQPASSQPASSQPTSSQPTKAQPTKAQPVKLTPTVPSELDSPAANHNLGPQPDEIGLLPRAVTDFPNSIWHVRPPAGGQYGPAPAEVFIQWLVEGRVDQQALVWRDDWQDWQQAASVFPEFYDAGPASSRGIAAPPPSATALPPVPPLAPAVSVGPRRDRRRKQRQRNIVIVAVLVVLFIGLLIALAIVLLNQTNG